MNQSDAFPEGIAYRDTGCSYHPACLTCPFAKCRYDTPGGERVVVIDRNEQVRQLSAQGYRAWRVADMVGMSTRQVYRIRAAKRATP